MNKWIICISGYIGQLCYSWICVCIHIIKTFKNEKYEIHILACNTNEAQIIKNASMNQWEDNQSWKYLIYKSSGM